MGHHQILHPVVIEVAHGDRITNIAAWDESYTPEGPVAVAQVHHDTTLTVRSTVRRYQVYAKDPETNDGKPLRSEGQYL